MPFDTAQGRPIDSAQGRPIDSAQGRPHEIERALKALIRRYRWVLAADRFLELAFVLTVGVATLLLLDRLAYELGVAELHATRPIHVIGALAGALALATAAALASAFFRRVDPAGVAWRADKVLGAEERFLTSVELSASGSDGGDGGPLAALVVQEAAQAVREAEPRRIIPASPVGYRWGVLLALAAGSALAASPPRLYAPPRADLSVAPLRGPAPLAVVCEDLSQGHVTRRTWDFGDGTTDPSSRAEHTFERPGRYAVRLLVEGPGGGDASDEVIVEALDPAEPFADFEAEPRRGRAPLEVWFRNRSRTADRFAWDFGDGGSSVYRDPVHRYEQPGLYTVTLDASRGGKADRAVRRDLVKVVGPDAPLADFRAWPRRGRAPLNVSFENTTTGQATEWEWDFGDGLSEFTVDRRDRNPTHAYRRPGRYTVTLRARGPGGEDVLTRRGYIEVIGDGEGSGGGGGGGAQHRSPGAGAGGGGLGSAGQASGQLFGEPGARPKVEFRDEKVTGTPVGPELVEKVKNVYVGGDQQAGGGQEQPYGKVFGDYRRAAEDAMNRELVPPALRPLVKRYFDGIRPR